MPHSQSHQARARLGRGKEPRGSDPASSSQPLPDDPIAHEAAGLPHPPQFQPIASSQQPSSWLSVRRTALTAISARRERAAGRELLVKLPRTTFPRSARFRPRTAVLHKRTEDFRQPQHAPKMNATGLFSVEAQSSPRRRTGRSPWHSPLRGRRKSRIL